MTTSNVTMTDLGNTLVQGSPLEETSPTDPRDRLVIRFDPATQTIYPASARRRSPLVGALLLHYRETLRRTPTGGRYFAKRMTIRYQDRRWVGQVKQGTDVVRLRPEQAPPSK